MVTQKDISAACGVSISSVSKALKDYSDISEETKQRIRDVAEKMGYHTIRKEVAVRHAHTYTVGLLITEESERKSSLDVVGELRKVLMGRGYDLVLLSPVREEKRDLERPGYLPRARLFGMEGVFLFSNMQEKDLYCRDDYRDLRELILAEIPVVAVGCFLSSCRCVLPSYETGIRNLVNEIYRRGHRRIAFVFKESMEISGNCYNAIRAALKENNLKVPDHYLKSVKEGSFREAFMKTMELVRGIRWIRPTCILFSDDTLLEGGTAAIRACGLRIPEDICVAAIRISDESKIQDFPVLSWRISPLKIAESAVGQMLQGSNPTAHSTGRVCLVDGILSEEEGADPLQLMQYQNSDAGICSKTDQ